MSATRDGSLLASVAIRPQDRRALLLGVVALVLMLGYARVARPALDQMRVREHDLSEQRDLLARERALLAIAPSLPALRRASERTLVAEDTRLFAGDSVGATAALTAYVADVATETGVRLGSVEARASSGERGVTRLVVDARGEGSWSKVLDFVAKLESSEQLVDVSSVRIDRGARGGVLPGGSSVSIAVTLIGYSRGAR